MPSFKAVILVCGLFVALGPAGYAGEDAITPARVSEIAPGVFVRPGVHALMNEANAGGIANIGFVVGSEAVAVIDSGGSLADGAALRAALRQRTKLPVRYVINTHVHPDHILGNVAFLADEPTFVGHRRLPAAMQARGAHYLEANSRLLGEAAAGSEIILPSLLVEDRMELDLGGRPLILTAHATAHTDNDLTVLDVESGILWTGDLLFAEHIPVIDGSLKGWLAVMDRLAAVPAKRTVPGHGPQSLAWPEAMAPQRGYLEALAADLRRMIAAGDTMREATGKAGAAQREAWLLFDEFNPRNATAGFAELEWE